MSHRDEEGVPFRRVVLGRSRPLVLIADDYVDTRELYGDYLTFAGYDVIMATDGAEAIAQAQARAPDVILMDLTMPGMDGWEATRRLKADAATRAIPVLALTAHAFSDFIESARAAGCDGFIAKPCLPHELLGHIRAAIEN